MKPDLTTIKREKVVIEPRKKLTRVQFAQLLLDQAGKCACGCGVKLQPMTEGVVDEHVLALGLAGSNALPNRQLWRKPCSKAKTDKRDLPAIAKAKRLADIEENGRAPGSIPSRPMGPSRGFSKTHTRKFGGKVVRRSP